MKLRLNTPNTIGKKNNSVCRVTTYRKCDFLHGKWIGNTHNSEEVTVSYTFQCMKCEWEGFNSVKSSIGYHTCPQCSSAMLWRVPATLPKEFVKAGLALAGTLTYWDSPLTEFSKDELLAALASVLALTPVVVG